MANNPARSEAPRPARAGLALLLLTATAFAGCADVLDKFSAPDYHVRSTPVEEGPTAWNRDARFRVVVAEAVEVHITATDTAGHVQEKAGQQEAQVVLPDGTWDISYTVGGHNWASFKGVRIDSTPPAISNLDPVGDADSAHRYTIGASALVTGAASLAVIDLQTGATIATSVPAKLDNLPDGLQAYLVTARDAAGNIANVTVQVRVGTAADLPAGRFTFGVVARYTNRVQLWDISHPQDYLSRAAAREAVANTFLGDGYGLQPGDPAVKAIADQVVTPDMNTMQGAIALFQWFAGHLSYDTTRLDSDTLLTPAEVINDSEDSNGRDANGDGLVDPGAGNGVHGGICRDLAATYVSLLRASGIPARLVSGYVAGSVNGFHAWVEFYAGRVGNQGAWVPVDVSPIDGHYTESVLLQAFGIQLPEYLALRTVPENGETSGWSTAIGVRYKWPQDQTAPVVDFSKQVTPVFSTTGVLCFNDSTRARATSDSESHCGPGYGLYIGTPQNPFVLTTERTIDYGIKVVQAPQGTQITAEVAYPVEESVHPNTVVFQFYGPAFTKDVPAGKAIAVFNP